MSRTEAKQDGFLGLENESLFSMMGQRLAILKKKQKQTGTERSSSPNVLAVEHSRLKRPRST
jgi:hypothetical protein